MLKLIRRGFWFDAYLKNNEIQLYLDTGKKWIDKKLKIFKTRNKEASYTRLFYIFN